jgi:subtilisin family serine protease
MKRRVLSFLTLLVILVGILGVSPVAGQDPVLTEAAEESSVISTFKIDAVKDAGRPERAPPDDMAGAPGAEALKPVSIIVTFDESVDAEALAAASGGQIVHTYKHVFNGASLILSEDKVGSIAALEGVTGIYEDKLLQIDTDRSPVFIGAPATWRVLGGPEEAGEGVVVGVLDTGIWPEHPSFADPDPRGKPYPEPPVQPGANGFGSRGEKNTCDFGNTAYNTDDAPFTCNNKLIGAYDFADTYKLLVGLLPNEFDSARDAEGHGTHTASTAAGNVGVEASIFGIDRGRISGIAPRAHVIMYKVCGDQGCYGSDSAAAVEQAILDQVDALNFSISGGGDPFSDAVSLAFLAAYDSGIFVAASAGNAGPGPDTTDHREPWVTTVGASTSDRGFLSTVTLSADNGDTLELIGATVTAGIGDPTPVVNAADYGDGLCLAPFPAGTFSGQIVVCERGVIARVEKSYNVAAGGAGGLLLYNPTLQGLNTDNHFIPSVHLENDSGALLLDFMATHTGVMGTFTAGVASKVQGDVMAAFSSRGGPGQILGVSKPDVTAPGVQILAGHSPLPATPVGGLPGELFQAIQGTSMSSPHVAGAAALLKDLYPDFTPGQIKSALMTRAKNGKIYKEDGVTPADVFDMGSGRINLRTSWDPGLTFDETAANYMALKDELWNANYPSIYIPNMPGRITVQRTAKDVLGAQTKWTFHTRTDRDWEIITPDMICLPANGEQTFDITIDASRVPVGEVRSGEILLEDGFGVLHIPVTFVRGQPAVQVVKDCDPTVIRRHRDLSSCTIAMQNTAFVEADIEMLDQVPWSMGIVPGTLTGADIVRYNLIKYVGTLSPAEPPEVNVAVDPLASPAGYLSLAGFGGTIDVGATDESIANFGVPSFEYAGEVYSQIGIVSNGYVVVGGGDGADVKFINEDMPNPSPPNNVLAPFWTDLNPDAGGRVLINLLTDGVNSWIVVEWESVPNWGDGETNSFQIWISYTQPDDISFVYGSDISDGDAGYLTVGAENVYGNSGGTIYFDGVGTPPAPSTTGYEVDVYTVPGALGGLHTVSYELIGWNRGRWLNCAEVTSDLWQGVAIDCVAGRCR